MGDGHSGDVTAQASVVVLRNYTCEPLETALRQALSARGLGLAVRFGDFDAYPQEILDPGSALFARAPDFVLLTLSLDTLRLAWTSSGALDVDAVLTHVAAQVSALQARGASTVVVTTFAPPLEALPTASLLDALELLNAGVRSLERVWVLDAAREVARLGERAALDPRYWFLYKAPFRAELLAALAQSFAARIAAQRGLGRKVLVLDCDQTLWGGVVGEDGPQGVALDPATHPGNIFHAFQRQLLALRRAGVLLALSSKNEEADVFEVLDHHPHAVLCREHLVGWRINWAPKAQALQELAQELNLGLDSFVFIDDSPTECAQVRAALPMVEVLQVPEKLSELPRLLAAYRGFALGAATPEDRARTRYYQEDRARTLASTAFGSVDDFLRTLKLEAEVGPPSASELPRVAQLTQKTNQFNLTTRRYSQAELEALIAQGAIVRRLVVRDRFGDSGLTGVAIAVREGEGARVDTFLLSCRVLGRRLEETLLAELLRDVDAAWAPAWVEGEHRATLKNGQTRDFYPRLGFTPAAAGTYRLGAHRPVSPEFIAVTRSTS
jgi:FkbH-like protein